MSQDKTPHKSARDRAVAIRYDDPQSLPSITATGVGEIARQIVDYAKSYGIPVEENSDLTALLKEVRIGDVINPESFRLVAELVSFLYHTDCEWGARHGFVKALVGAEPGNIK